jgi:hypothetical protein
MVHEEGVMAHLSHRQKITAVVAACTLVILTLGGLTWLLLNPGDHEPIADAVPQSTITTTTPTLAEPDAAQLEDDATRPGNGGGGEWGYEPGLPLPPMGIQSVTLEWDRIDLPGPETGEYWMNQLLTLDDRLIVSGGWFDEQSGEEGFFVLESPDGLTWTDVALPLEATESGPGQLAAAGNTLVAFTHDWEHTTGRPDVSVFLSSDLSTWTEVDVSAFTEDDEVLWLWQAAGHGEALLLGGHREPYYPDPGWIAEPIYIHKNGLTLEIDTATRSFLITDDATGEVLLHGTEELMWDYQRDEGGAVLYNQDTGERVFAMPWDELNQRAMEIYATTPFGGDLVLDYESEGRRLTFDQFSGELVVTEVASGSVVYRGTEDELWQGQPPTFINPHTDTVVLRLTWDEWNEAHAAAYEGFEEGDYWVDTIILSSRDGGASFEEVDLSTVAGDGFHLATLAAGPNGFIATGGIEGPWLYEDQPYEPNQLVLTSADGLAWTMAASLEPDGWINTMTAGPDNYYASMGTETGCAVLRSADGETWKRFLEVADLALPMGSAWFDDIAVGDFGVFARGQRDGWDETYEELPFVISKQGRTLTIDGTVYTLVDDATGAQLFTFDEQESWQQHEATGDDYFTPVRWGEGGFAIFDESGTLLFALSHEEQWQDDEWEEPEVWYEPEQLLLRHDGTAWSSVELPEEIGPNSWITGFAVGQDRVVLAATVEEHTAGEWSTSPLILIGTE